MNRFSLSYFDPRTAGSKNDSNTHSRVDVVFRVALSLIFIVGGLGHFGRQEWMLQRLLDSPWLDWVLKLGSPTFFLELSGIVMLITGVGLLIGLCTRLSALALFVTLVPITFVIHIAPDHTGPLFKNIAILGALLHFYIYGSNSYSVDRVIQKRDEINKGYT